MQSWLVLRNPCQNICVLVLVNGPSSHTSSSFHQSNTRTPLKVLFRASSKRVHTHHHHLCNIWTNKYSTKCCIISLLLSTLLFPLFPELQTGDRTESVEVRLGVPWRYGRSRSWGPRPSSAGPSQSVRCPGAGHPHQPPTSPPLLLSFS